MAQAFITRAAVAAHHGLAEAGAFSLSYDVGIRIVAVTATALDVLLFQLAVRADREQGRDAALARVGRNLAVVLAVLLPTAAGYGLVLPHFAAVFVPEARAAGLRRSLARFAARACRLGASSSSACPPPSRSADAHGRCSCPRARAGRHGGARAASRAASAAPSATAWPSASP